MPTFTPPLQSAISGPSPNSSHALQFPLNVTAGNLIIVKAWGANATALFTVTDDQGNTYTRDDSDSAVGTDGLHLHAQIHSAVAATGGVRPTVTITVFTVFLGGASIAEYGHPDSTVFDGGSNAEDDSTNGSSTATFSTGHNNELAIAFGVAGTNGSFSGSGWTNRDTWSGSASSSAVAYDRTVTTSGTSISATEFSDEVSLMLVVAYRMSPSAFFSQSLSDTMSISEVIVRATRTFFIDLATPVDTPRFLTKRSSAETLTLSDAEFGRANKRQAETFTVTEALVLSTVRAWSDTVSLVSSLRFATSRTISDVISSVDALAGKASRHMADTITFAETFVGSFSRLLSDTVSVTDSLTRFAKRTQSEVLSATDSLRHASSTFFSDAISILDAFTIAGAKSVSLIESLSISDLLKRMASRHQSDTIASVDALRGSRGISGVESITVADSLVKRISKRLSDVVSWIEQIIHSTNPGFGIPRAAVTMGSVPVSRVRVDAVPRGACVLSSVPVLDWHAKVTAHLIPIFPDGM